MQQQDKTHCQGSAAQPQVETRESLGLPRGQEDLQIETATQIIGIQQSSCEQESGKNQDQLPKPGQASPIPLAQQIQENESPSEQSPKIIASREYTEAQPNSQPRSQQNTKGSQQAQPPLTAPTLGQPEQTETKTTGAQPNPQPRRQQNIECGNDDMPPSTSPTLERPNYADTKTNESQPNPQQKCQLGIQGSQAQPPSTSSTLEQPNQASEQEQLSEIQRARLEQQKRLEQQQKRNEKLRKKVRQLRETEEEYVRKLREFVQKVKKPMQQECLVSRDDGKLIFSNIQKILQLHETVILPAIAGMLERFDPQKSKISNCFLPYIQFFKIYNQNNEAYNSGDQLLRELRNKNKELHKFLEKLESDSKMYSHFIDNFRSRPFQRLCKYGLFFKEIENLLDSEHPDKRGLQNLLAKMGSILSINDRFLGEEELKQLTYNLEMKHGVGDSILHASRRLKHKLRCRIISYREELADLYLFNDLIVTIGVEKDERLEDVRLNFASVIEAMSETKYFKNLVFVVGTNVSKVLHFASRKEAEEFIAKGEEVLRELKFCHRSRRAQKDPNEYKFIESLELDKCPFSQIVVIRVLYAEQELDPSTMRTETVYCLEFEANVFRFRKKYTLDCIEQLIATCTERYEDRRISIDTTSKDMGYLEAYTNGSKIMEFRRLAIQVSLNSLFKKNKVLRDSTFLLNRIGVRDKYYNLIMFDLRKDSTHSAVYNNRAIQMEVVERAVLSGKRIHPAQLVEYLFHYRGRIDQVAFETEHSSLQTIDVHVFTSLVESRPPLRVKVRKNCTVRVLLNAVKVQLQLFFIEDFCLAVKETNSFRRLDFDEIVFETAEEAEDTSSRSILHGLISSTLSYVTRRTSKPQLFLRKWFYLPPVVGEDVLFSTGTPDNDLTRLKLILQDLFWRLQKGEFVAEKSQVQLALLLSYYIFVFFHNEEVNILDCFFIESKVRLFVKEELVENLTVRVEEFLQMLYCKYSEKQSLLLIYRDAVQQFGEFAYTRLPCEYNKMPAFLTIAYNHLAIEGVGIDEGLRYENIRVSWSPKSIFIESNSLVHRVDLKHPYSVCETILMYRDIAQFKANL